MRCFKKNLVEPIVIHPSFDHDSIKYRCCFRRGIHIRTCGLLITVLELVIVVCILSWMAIGYENYNLHRPIRIYDIEPRYNNSRFQFRPTRLVEEIDPWKNGTDTSIGVWARKMVESDHIAAEFLILSIGFACMVVSVSALFMLYAILGTKPDHFTFNFLFQGVFAVCVLGAAFTYACAPSVILALIPNRWLAVVIFGSAFALDLYFMYCVHKCRRYINDKRTAMILARPVVPRDDAVTTYI